MKKFLCTLILITICSFDAKSDLRSYVWTYEYQTLSRGEKELEHYLTLSSPDINEMKGKTTAQHQIEFEMGMTDNFDIGIYQVFSQKPLGNFQYDEFKLRARYKIGEKDKYFVNPLIYLEYIGKPDFSEHEIEFKLILGKDFGKFNVSFNPYLELAKKESEWEISPLYALGVNYMISDLFRFGMEFKGNKDANYFGPVISHGSESAYIAVGSAFKIGNIKDGATAISFRTIIGIKL
jgi:hypothetical protein